MRASKPRAGGRALLGLVVVAVLFVAACGSETTSRGLRSTATPLGSNTGPTVAPSPTNVPPPYAFAKTWQTAQGAPTHIGPNDGMAFAASAPSVGYACDNTPPPALAQANSAHPAAFLVTHDGGQTWVSGPAVPFAQMFGLCEVLVNPSDANDILLLAASAQSGQPMPGIWRSRDGGTSWRQLTYPTVPGVPSIAIREIAVFGARLVVAVDINGEGQLPNNLYASDDGGTSWHQFAASLPPNVNGFVALGASSLIVESDPPLGAAAIPNPIAATAASQRALGAAMPRSRLSSGGPPPVFYRSNDAGNTWAKVTIPGSLPFFTQAASGNNFYGVSIAAPKTQGDPSTAFWSADSGQTWHALPTLQGVENGWVDPTSLGIGLVVAPDGSVLTDTLHPLGNNAGEEDAGIFVLRPTDSAPAWQPLATGPSFGAVALPTSGGVRLLNVQSGGAAQFNGTPVYLNLP